MIDRSMLLDALRTNGLEPESSDEEILRVFSALGYGRSEREEALKLIRTKFPAPTPYTPEDPTKNVPKEPIKIERIKLDLSAPAPVIQTPIKIPRVVLEKPEAPAPIPAPIKIPAVPKEKKEEAALTEPVKLAAVAFVATPPPPPVSPAAPPPTAGKSASLSGRWRFILYTIYIVVFLLIILGIPTYLYINKAGPFALKTYSEDTLASNLLSNGAGPNFKPSTYAVTASITAAPREAQFASSTASSSDYVFPTFLNSIDSIPADITLSILANASVEHVGTSTNWILNLNSRGTLSSAGYTFDTNIIKKNADYYVKINRAPLLFLGEFSAIQGKWMSVPHATSTTATSSNPTDAISMYSDLYTSQVVPLISHVTELIGKGKLLGFKGKPYSEKVNGQYLVHYELAFTKDANVKANPETSMTLWADENGLPVSVALSYTIVPPTTAKNLKDKQLNITFKLSFSDINKAIAIQAPSNPTIIDSNLQKYINLLYKNIGAVINQLN